ncbi:MAG: hypothetical protein LBE03_01705 [Candidatus Nomurabacteria bacterium]|jgi:hypothetical protein|nr:hypothetical protein [Candidatus Nomurabacteria bacterium]
MQNEQPMNPVPAPVVPNVQLPKLAMPQKSLATLNAFSIAFSVFFGAISIFGAIADFAEKWSFGIPVIGSFNITGIVPTVFITAFMAVVFGVIGLLTVRKITDAEALKASYGKAAGFFTILSIIFTSIVVATIFYALFALGKKSGVVQKDLWLSGFLPALLVAITSITSTIFTKQVAAGKTALLRIFSFVALGVAGIGFILVIISTLVGFYGESSSSYDYDDIYDTYRNLLNY